MNEATISDPQMKDALKPYGLGEILDRTVQIYRRNFLLFVGIAALPTLLLIVTAAGAGVSIGWLGRTRSDTASLIVGLIFFLLILIVFPLWVAIQSIANGALTGAAVKMHEGEKIKIRGALSAAWKKGWRYIGIQFLVYLFVGIIPGAVLFFLVMLAGLISTLAGFGGASLGSGVIMGGATFVGITAFCVFIVLAMIRLSLAFAVCTVEELGPWNSIQRSFGLTKGSMGRIFLFGLLVYVLTMAITLAFVMICLIPFFILLALIHGAGSVAQQRFVTVAILVIYYAAIFLAQVVIKPVYSIGLTVFYFDERVRKEGYDIEWMMKRAGLVDAGGPDAQTVPWMDAAQFGAQTNSAQDGQPGVDLSAETRHAESGGE